MQKKELRKLKRINATRKMVELSKNNKRKTVMRSIRGNACIEKSTVYDLLVRCQTRGKYLMVCIFVPEDVAAGKLTPKYEIYCNPEGDEYITRILSNGQEEKWSEAMVENLGRCCYLFYNSWHYKTEERIWQNPEGKDTIQKILHTSKKGIMGLQEWQEEVRKRRIEGAEKRQQAPWDADMKLVPELMPSFRSWLEKEGPKEHFIFYEYSRKGAEEGYCSYCRRMVPVRKPKHNKEGRCSKCGMQIKYKAASRIQTLETNEYEGQVIQKIRGGSVIRTFKGIQWYRDTGFRHPKSRMYECERILLMENGTVKRYYYGLYKNKFQRWIQDKDYIPCRNTYYRQITIKLYKRNLPALKKTVLKNSAADLWETLPTDVANYLAIEKGNPAVEKLARIGMFTLAADLMKIKYDSGLLNEGATELAKMLKIDNARLKRLKAIDGDTIHLRWYQYEKEVDRIWPDEMIKDFGDNGFETSAAFGFLTAPLSYVKIWNYLKKQSQVTGESMRRLRDTWNDYLNMAEKAGMDVKSDMIWKPKDLKEAHYEVIMILQKGNLETEAKKLEKKWPKVNSNMQKLQKFEYTDGKFSILAPREIMDIVKEGTALRHCVHTCDFYFDRIQRDETYLFFLRRAEHENLPWYTLEVEPSGNIRQKRTTGDNQNKDFEEAIKFLKKWQKVFKERMTQEEKELGVKANRARLEEYEKLRKDGNRIWHGRLAGKLLADVLENDFMEAM